MIRIANLQMAYRAKTTSHQAVRGISLTVENGAFYTLLGPSGCGKTTTLRCVAGLERPDSGEIVVADRVVYSSARNIWVPSHERQIGMVFQSYAIWPHMTVFQNVAFPLRYVKPRPNASEVKERVRGALELVKLGGLEDRPAPFLSGGQQQRLALARALVAEPRVLLLDEPLSNLDAKLREEMRTELSELVSRLNVTTLFVTHEQAEALTMSDLVGVMSNGQIKQEGSPEAIYGMPTEPFVAHFIGKINFLEGKILAISGHGAAPRVRVNTEIGVMDATPQDTYEGNVGDTVTIAIRPENIVLGTATSQGARHSGLVKSVVYLGNMADCTVEIGPIDLRVQLHPLHKPAIGSQVELVLPAEHCLALRGQRLDQVHG
jgi:iron(III) transport system ATP-binding protein